MDKSNSNNGEPSPKRPRRNFSVDWILNEAGSSSRRFSSIDRLLEQSNEEKYNKIEKAKLNLKSATIPQFGEGIDLSQHFRTLDQQEDGSQKFKLMRNKTTFLMESVSDLPDPSSALAQCFQTCIDQAIERAESSDLHPDRIGVTISSVNLSTDIVIPFSRITDNTLYTIWNRFRLIEQSQSHESSLLGAPFQVAVTLINKQSLPKEKRTAGNGRRKNDVKHNITPGRLVKIKNTDNYCLFHALEVMRIHESMHKTKKITYEQMRYLINNERKRREYVDVLLRETGIPRDLKEYDVETYVPIVQDYWNRVYPGKFKVFVFAEYGQYKPVFKSAVGAYIYPVLLYHSNNHFDGIRYMNKFFTKNKYCLECETTYQSNKTHTLKCKIRCHNCCGMGLEYPCKSDGTFRKCEECSKEFNNAECYQKHLTKNMCNNLKYCSKCGVYYSMNDLLSKGATKHICYETFCRQCHAYHSKKRPCYIQKLEPKEDEPYRLVFFDFESQQTNQPDPSIKRFLHEVNFAAAITVCSVCLAKGKWQSSLSKDEPCEICGPHRTHTFSPVEFSGTVVDKKITSANPLGAFVDWLLYQQDPNYKTIAFSHFGGRYDVTLIFGEILKRGKIVPSMIRQGNKMYEMRVGRGKQNPETIFRDSYNLIPVKLERLVKAFGLPMEPKMYFPHLYNCEANYNEVNPTLPDKDMYLYKSMKPEDKDKFESWYEAHRNEPFDLNEKLAEYCLSDVQILCHALIALRKEFFEITRRDGTKEESQRQSDVKEEDESKSTERDSEKKKGHEGIDILYSAMTIASAVMQHYRMNHLKKDWLAIIPERGYDAMDNQSLLAKKYLRYYEEKMGRYVQTAESPEGEYRVPGTNYRLDGFIRGQEGELDLGIEVNGCVWHAHHEEFPENTMMMPSGKTAGKIRDEDQKRLDKISEQMEVGVIWECQINEQLKNDPEMRKAFEDYMDNGSLVLRDSFAGGRVGSGKVFHEAKPGHTIRYLDFTSLYPYTNAVTNYPVGHPSLKMFYRKEQIAYMKKQLGQKKKEFLCQDVHWKRASDITHKGILKVLVFPPRNCNVPVLPAKFDDRLLFPLCRKCAKDYRHGGRIDDYSCGHADDERSFVSTCTSIELAAALEAGYEVRKIFRALEYTEWDDSLFKDYVAEFMRLKIHATGFQPGLTCEQEEKFIDECKIKFGITVDRDKMAENPAKKTLAKLSLNALWGRFALRNQLSKTIITNSPAELRKYLDDRKLDVLSVNMVSEELVMITYSTKMEFLEEHATSNLLLSIWTTSAARLKLLEALQSVAKKPGAEILYYDTDSVVYSFKDEGGDPLNHMEGLHLGDLTDEYPDHTILEFVSGGCKNYALKLQRKTDGKVEFATKIRGITLDFNACQALHYETFKRKCMAFDTGEEDPITIHYPSLLRPDLKTGTVSTIEMSKIYRPVISKGIVNAQFEVLNFGHCN